jgi:DNA-binding NarL/FixJ family response regulator
MKYLIVLKADAKASGSDPAPAARGGLQRRSRAVTIVIADMSEVVRTWMHELLRVRSDWTVICSTVDASSIAECLPRDGTQIAIIGSPHPALALNTAEELKAVSPTTRIILFTEFDSPLREHQAKKHVEGVVSRTTVLAAGMLAAVETLLRDLPPLSA